MFATMQKLRQLFGTLRRYHWAMSLHSEFLGWSPWGTFDSCCQIFGPLSRLFKNKRCHLVMTLQSRLLKLAIRRGEGGGGSMPDVDHLLFSLAVLQQLLLFDADSQVFESPKKKEKMSTVINQQDETKVPTLSRSQVMLTSLFSPHSDG